MNYRVIWEIDIEADTALEAVVRARSYQADPDTSAVVFDTYDENGNHMHIDLMGIDFEGNDE